MDIKNSKLKIFRSSLNMTQEEMATALGIKRAAYSSVENGVNNLTLEHLTVLFTKYNLNPIWYLIGAGNMKIDTQDMMQFIAGTHNISVVQENQISKVNSLISQNGSNVSTSNGDPMEVELKIAKLQLEAAQDKISTYEAYIKNLQEMVDMLKNANK